jgi:hypothetical protein
MSSELIKDMVIARETVLGLLRQLDEVEKDPEISNESKLVQIEKIKLQLEEIHIRIDNFRREIKLMSTRRMN